MSSSPDFERAKSQLGIFEKIEDFIPGFRGYKEKELRRESDRLVRDRLYRSLSAAEGTFKDTYRMLVEAKVGETWNDADHLVAKFDRIVEQINHADYGYAGFFDAMKVREPDLDRMIDFDSKMVDSVQAITQAVETLESQVSSDKYDQARQQILQITNMVNDLEAAFSQRKNVIMGASG